MTSTFSSNFSLLTPGKAGKKLIPFLFESFIDRETDFFLVYSWILNGLNRPIFGIKSQIHVFKMSVLHSLESSASH